jgi:hypothetical protein
MDSGQGTFQCHRLAQFLQSQIGFLAQGLPHFPAMDFQNLGLAPGKMVTRSNVSSALALLEELFDQTQRNPIPFGYFLPGAFLLIV